MEELKMIPPNKEFLDAVETSQKKEYLNSGSKLSYDGCRIEKLDKLNSMIEKKINDKRCICFLGESDTEKLKKSISELEKVRDQLKNELGQ
jgi:hypothetical protein